MPFAQAFAAVITAALTGSLYYVAASPKGWLYRTSFLTMYLIISFPTLWFTSFFLHIRSYLCGCTSFAISLRSRGSKKALCRFNPCSSTYQSVNSFMVLLYVFGVVDIFDKWIVKYHESFTLTYFCWTLCSLVWKKANEKDLLSTSGRTPSPLSWVWMDPGNPGDLLLCDY